MGPVELTDEFTGLLGGEHVHDHPANCGHLRR